MPAYPLLLDPILKPKVWGGRRLERLGKPLPDDESIGESWELADLRSTDPEGGGGGAAESRIARGEMKGLTIREAVFAMGPNLMGSLRPLPGDDGFPLLLKYLDAHENLSVQVHPSPEYARAHAGARLKTESWYVVEAEPGSVIYCGVRPGVTRDRFESGMRAGNIVEDLKSLPVEAGDYFDLPSGTCHALGAGVLVAEIQTPSDTTFRLFDWGRKGRALHIDEALECMSFEPVGPTAATRGNGSSRCLLGVTPYYNVHELRILGDTSHRIENRPPPPSGGPMVWMIIRGEGRLRSADDSWAPVSIEPGHTVLFPAAIETCSADFSRDATVLEIRFPRAGTSGSRATRPDGISP